MNETQEHYVILTKKQDNNNHQQHQHQNYQHLHNHHLNHTQQHLNSNNHHLNNSHQHFNQQQQQQDGGEENNYGQQLVAVTLNQNGDIKQQHLINHMPVSPANSIHHQSMNISGVITSSSSSSSSSSSNNGGVDVVSVSVKNENNISGLSKQQIHGSGHLCGHLDIVANAAESSPGVQVTLAPLQTAQENTTIATSQQQQQQQQDPQTTRSSTNLQQHQQQQQQDQSSCLVIANNNNNNNHHHQLQNTNINNNSIGSTSNINAHVSATNNNAPTTNTELQQTVVERRYRPQKYCAVCGDKAIACNFNAVTCESCKAFFRRNAFKEQRLKCLFDNRCIIDRVTRRFCSKCRLLKCLQIGMKREWILTDEQKHIKRVKIMQNKQSRQQVPNSPTTNLHHHTDDQSSTKLNTSDKSSTLSSSGANNNRNLPFELDNQQQQVSDSSSNQMGGVSIRRRSSQIKVETKDATTSCPDEFELAATQLTGANNLVHFCSLASQCQYCSLRLSGCSPTAQPISNEYQHQTQHQHQHHMIHHQQQQQQQQHTIDPIRDSYGHQSGGGNHLSAQMYSNDTSNQMQPQQQQQTNQQLIQPDLIDGTSGGLSNTATGAPAATFCCLEPQNANYNQQQQHLQQSSPVVSVFDHTVGQ